jgi:hypothetical protein
MNLGEIAPLPAFRTKKAVAPSGFLKSVLFGRKNLSPEALGRIRKIVTESGYALPQEYKTQGGIGRTVFRTMFGEGPNRLNILKARMQQGGLFGKGGVMHGDIAFDPEFFESIKKFKEGDRSLKRALSIGGHGLTGGLNVAFTAGLPLATAASYLKGDSTGADVASEGLSALGMSLGAPFGMVGAMAGGSAATALADLFRSDNQQQPSGPVPPASKAGLAAARSAARTMVKGMPSAYVGYSPNDLSFAPPDPEIYLPPQY